MARDAAKSEASNLAAQLGRAIAATRERVGISQEELADRMGVARQTVSRYEGGRSQVLRTDVQEQIARALGVEVRELTEPGNIIDGPPAWKGKAGRSGEPNGNGVIKTVVAVQAAPEMGEDGELHYAEVPPLSSEDLGWLFGPNAGFLRLADGTLPEGAFTARVAGYDKSAWPRQGQGCVIETRSGELLPRIYHRRTAAGVQVEGGEGIGQHTIPAGEIRGVYAIRFWGD